MQHDGDMAFIRFVWEPDPPEEPVFALRLGGNWQGKMPSFKPQFRKKVDSELVLDWVTELGFKQNPFEATIMLPASEYIANFAREKEKINLFLVNRHRFGKIMGEEGSGKTILLMWLSEQLQGYSSKLRSIFIDARQLGQDSLLDILFEKATGLRRKAVDSADEKKNVIKDRLKGKRLVVLIDNLEYLSKGNLSMAEALLESTDIQIIATSIGKVGSIDEKDGLRLKIGTLDPDAMKEMVEKRIRGCGGTGLAPFSERQLDRIYKTDAKNPRQLLKICSRKAIELAVKRMKEPYAEADEPEIRPSRQGDSYHITEVRRNSDEDVVIRTNTEKSKKEYVINKVK